MNNVSVVRKVRVVVAQYNMLHLKRKIFYMSKDTYVNMD